MRNQLNFDEIKGWQDFESLTAKYFELLKNDKDSNITEVKTQSTGEGSDGGRDILITFRVNDSICIFERRWVVQCKFHNNSVGLKAISDVNIPTLIHQYNANGYLLVCKNNVVSKTSEMFEKLNQNCKFGYKYEIWKGADFIQRLLQQEQLFQQFFPEYYQYIKSQNINSNII